MSQERSNRIVVIGIGNEYRGDDAAGLMVARRLKTAVLSNVVVKEACGEGTALIDLWKHAETVFLIDAVQSGETPGRLHRWELPGKPIPGRSLRCSTHSVGVLDALELARALNRLPTRVVVYGIEGKGFGLGPGLSSEVMRAVQDTANAVVNELQGCSEPEQSGGHEEQKAGQPD